MRKRILLTNHHLTDFAGSEIATLDLAKCFKALDYEVIVSTLIYDQPIRTFFEKEKIDVVNLLEHKLPINVFDIIWAHHSPVLNYLLFEERGLDISFR